MADDVILTITGPTWDALQRLGLHEDALRAVLVDAMHQLTDAVIAGLVYPPQSNAALPLVYARPHMRKGLPTGYAYRSGFKTLKQQRYFFAALRAGTIRVPYKRRHSAGLKGSWSKQEGGSGVAVEGDADFQSAVVGTVGINETYAPYAKYVVGNDAQQAAYHKGWWWQFEPKVAQLARDHVWQAVGRATADMLKKLLAR